MYEFMDRLINLAIPRVRDFRGLNPNAFDGKGNYSIGLSEQSVFPEINPAKIEFQQGMNVTFVTTAGTDEEAKEMLSLFGMPFREPESSAKAEKD
jgi:large subunit ribosomal protein L5